MSIRLQHGHRKAGAFLWHGYKKMLGGIELNLKGIDKRTSNKVVFFTMEKLQSVSFIIMVKCFASTCVERFLEFCFPIEPRRVQEMMFVK